MALTGVHIVFGYAKTSEVYKDGASLAYNAQSSQTMSTPQTSTISAPSSLNNSSLGKTPVLLSIQASLAIWFVTGPNPDINSGPRRYYDGTVEHGIDIYVDPGDKFAWTTA